MDQLNMSAPLLPGTPGDMLMEAGTLLLYAGHEETVTVDEPVRATRASSSPPSPMV